MKGNRLQVFLHDILVMGGPEKEYEYRGKTYFLQVVYNREKKRDELEIFQCFGKEEEVYRCYGANFRELLKQYIAAPIYDGRTILEAHKEIEVLFG